MPALRAFSDKHTWLCCLQPSAGRSAGQSGCGWLFASLKSKTA